MRALAFVRSPLLKLLCLLATCHGTCTIPVYHQVLYRIITSVAILAQAIFWLSSLQSFRRGHCALLWKSWATGTPRSDQPAGSGKRRGRASQCNAADKQRQRGASHGGERRRTWEPKPWRNLWRGRSSSRKGSNGETAHPDSESSENSEHAAATAGRSERIDASAASSGDGAVSVGVQIEIESSARQGFGNRWSVQRPTAPSTQRRHRRDAKGSSGRRRRSSHSQRGWSDAARRIELGKVSRTMRQPSVAMQTDGLRKFHKTIQPSVTARRDTNPPQ